MGPSGRERNAIRQATKAARKEMKKEKDRKKKGGKLSFDELMQAAELATTSADPFQAIALYTAALKSLQQNNAALNSTDEMDTDSDRAFQSVEVLEKRAELYVSVSNQGAAREDYKEALQCLTTVRQEEYGAADLLEKNASLNMYIGQLSEGADALACYRKGIESLQQAVVHRKRDVESKNTQVQNGAEEMEDDNDDDENATPEELLQESQKQLASALCTASELFMTDLCFEEHAEEQCESYLQQALLLTDPTNENEPCVDALQIIASHRLSQSRGFDAVGYILRAYAQMRIGCEALASIVGVREAPQEAGNGAKELLNLKEVQSLPGFEFRCQTAKLLLECANFLKDQQDENSADDLKLLEYRKNQQQCTNAAVDVLGSLLAENDEVVEIWSLLGDAYSLKCNKETDNDYKVNADLSCQYWERAKEMLDAVRESLIEEQRQAEDQEEEDEIQQQLDEIVCQLEDLQSKLETVKDEEDSEEAMEE